MSQDMTTGQLQAGQKFIICDTHAYHDEQWFIEAEASLKNIEIIQATVARVISQIRARSQS